MVDKCYTCFHIRKLKLREVEFTLLKSHHGLYFIQEYVPGNLSYCPTGLLKHMQEGNTAP